MLTLKEAQELRLGIKTSDSEEPSTSEDSTSVIESSSPVTDTELNTESVPSDSSNSVPASIPSFDDILDSLPTYITDDPNVSEVFNDKRCPRCHAPLKTTPSISGAPSTDWLECSNSVCNTFVDMYHPMPHQASVHRDSHRIIGNFGSYGTGKTKTSEKEIEKHIFITPNANILLGANITSQYEQTLLRDFEKSFPQAFMESRSQQKGYIDFINGARLMLRPFDDPDKLRSNNYSLVVMLEASEIAG